MQTRNESYGFYGTIGRHAAADAGTQGETDMIGYEYGFHHDAACMFFRQNFHCTVNHFEASRLYLEAVQTAVDPIAHARAAQIDATAHRSAVVRITGRMVRRRAVLREIAQRAAEKERATQAVRDAAKAAYPDEWAASVAMTDGRARREAQRLLRRRVEAQAHA